MSIIEAIFIRLALVLSNDVLLLVAAGVAVAFGGGTACVGAVNADRPGVVADANGVTGV